MSDQPLTFARVENDVITEYPVLPIHIVNRGHPFAMYAPVVFREIPTVPVFHTAVEVPSVGKTTDGTQCVYVDYKVVPMTLEMLFTLVPGYTPEGEEQRPVTEAPDPQLVNAIHELTKERITAKLNAFAQERQYDDIVSLASYATSNNPQRKLEGQAGVDLRDDTWDALYAYDAKVAAGELPLPYSYQDIDKHMPVLKWPDAVEVTTPVAG